MGQKVHPKAFRLPITFDWESRWIADKKRYREFLEKDIQIRGYVMKNLKRSGV